MTTDSIGDVSVATKANVYFDGKCVSHGLTFADGRKCTVGVILPSTLTFSTGAPEVMEGTTGRASVSGMTGAGVSELLQRIANDA